MSVLVFPWTMVNERDGTLPYDPLTRLSNESLIKWCCACAIHINSFTLHQTKHWANLRASIFRTIVTIKTATEPVQCQCRSLFLNGKYYKNLIVIQFQPYSFISKNIQDICIKINMKCEIEWNYITWSSWVMFIHNQQLLLAFVFYWLNVWYLHLSF